MHSHRRFNRILLAAALAGGLVVITGVPVFALGHRGDAREIAALRGAGHDRGSPLASSEDAPEIDGGAIASAIALVVGGLLLTLDRRQR